MKRCSGIIMSISSLPSPYGIGTFGRAAYDFTDFLASAGQSVWQILPLGPTGYGDSPYQSFSTYAGNPYFIDLDMLAEEGLLTQEEIMIHHVPDLTDVRHMLAILRSCGADFFTAPRSAGTMARPLNAPFSM